MITSRLRTKTAAVALAAATGVVLTTGVVAAAPTGPKVYHGCASKKTGALRFLVGRQHCHLKVERPVNWNKRGPVGYRGPTGFQGPKGLPGVGRPALFYTTKSLVGATPLTTSWTRVSGLTGLPAGSYLIEANVTVAAGAGEQADHNVMCGIGTPGSPDTINFPVTGYVRPQFPSTASGFHEADIWERGQAAAPDVYLECQDLQAGPGATVTVDHVTLVATAIRSATTS